MGCDWVSCKRGVDMNVKDLGELSGPVLLFGGPYSNLQAFQAIVDVADKLSVPPAQMICTGDVVAYCADAEATVQAIRAVGCPVVAGNCEKQLADGADDCGCGFDESSECSILSHGWYAHASAQVSSVSRDWMRALPDMIAFTREGLRYAVIHGGVSDISRFIWSTSNEDALIEDFCAVERLIGEVNGIIAGHSGLPFVREVHGKQWINAGAIGMPPNDGAPDTRYVVLDGSPKIMSLDYNHAKAKDRMVSAGLTQGYDVALESGYWPSEDTLPASLRRR